MEPQRISQGLTTHHVLKVIALVIMTIDHIGGPYHENESLRSLITNRGL